MGAMVWAFAGVVGGLVAVLLVLSVFDRTAEAAQRDR